MDAPDPKPAAPDPEEAEPEATDTAAAPVGENSVDEDGKESFPASDPPANY